MEKVRLEKLEDMDYGITEAMRSLRTNISFCGDEIHSIIVTSTVPDEGKSELTMDLARAMVEDGKKVILLDGDLRKSVMVGRYGIVLEKKGTLYGMSHYLSGQKRLDEIICETNIEGLDLVVAGPVVPNPTEILGNHYFEEMLDELKQKYDMVLVDGTPLGSVIDTAVVAPKCDGAILVIEQGKVSKKFIQNAKKQLENSGVKILGVVLNKVKRHTTGYYKEYYKAYYGEYAKKPQEDQ